MFAFPRTLLLSAAADASTHCTLGRLSHPAKVGINIFMPAWKLAGDDESTNFGKRRPRVPRFSGETKEPRKFRAAKLSGGHEGAAFSHPRTPSAEIDNWVC